MPDRPDPQSQDTGLPATPRSPGERRRRATFSEDFRRFFKGGLAALLPTLITLWLLVKIWDFLWESLGQHIIYAIKWLWLKLGGWWIIPEQPAGYIKVYFETLDPWKVQLLGVALAILLVYVVGLFVGNLIGRTMWRVAERTVMRIPILRAVYPAVKQVTDFLLAPKPSYATSQVVACQPHASGIWSIALVTGPGLPALTEATGEDTVTVFVPSSPTAFSGYVMVVPRRSVVELPLSVEEAMRLLISGGVINPKTLAASGKRSREDASEVEPESEPDAGIQAVPTLPPPPAQ